MTGPFTQDKIENWVSYFCISDALRPFSPAIRDIAADILLAFLAGACEVRGIEPEDLEETDARTSLLGPTAQLAIPEAMRSEVPALCGALLAHLETEGRLGGGRVLGAFTKALTDAYLPAASGKEKPAVRPGSKIGPAFEVADVLSVTAVGTAADGRFGEADERVVVHLGEESGELVGVGEQVVGFRRSQSRQRQLAIYCQEKGAI